MKDLSIELQVKMEKGVGATYIFEGQVLLQNPIDNSAAREIAFGIARGIIYDRNRTGEGSAVAKGRSKRSAEEVHLRYN